MVVERYQLVAIDEKNNEYIIELNNDNKNNKGTLNFLDSGISRFQNEQHLATYLYKQGKIPNVPVKFVIRYNNMGVKELPLMFFDSELYTLSKIANNNAFLTEYALKYYLKLENALKDEEFYNYLMIINSKNTQDQKNGNFLNEHLITNISNLYKNFIIIPNPTSEKVEIQYSIINDLTNYKQLRTLHYFYQSYANRFVKGNIVNETKETKKATFESLLQRESNRTSDVPEELQSAYNENGMDGVWAVADADEIIGNGYKFK